MFHTFTKISFLFTTILFCLVCPRSYLYCIETFPFANQMGYDEPMKEKLQRMHDPVPAFVLYHCVAARAPLVVETRPRPESLLQPSGTGRCQRWMHPSL